MPRPPNTDTTAIPERAFATRHVAFVALRMAMIAVYLEAETKPKTMFFAAMSWFSFVWFHWLIYVPTRLLVSTKTTFANLWVDDTAQARVDRTARTLIAVRRKVQRCGQDREVQVDPWAAAGDAFCSPPAGLFSAERASCHPGRNVPDVRRRAAVRGDGGR